MQNKRSYNADRRNARTPVSTLIDACGSENFRCKLASLLAQTQPVTAVRGRLRQASAVLPGDAGARLSNYPTESARGCELRCAGQRSWQMMPGRSDESFSSS